MKMIFLDSDILLDVILVRLPHFTFSSKLLDRAEREQLHFCTTVHCLLNIHYFTKKQLGKEKANNAIKRLAEKIHIVKEDGEIVELALASVFSDFEDAVQYYAATNAGCDAIITRNLKDYKNSNIPVLTAEQFLNTL